MERHTFSNSETTRLKNKWKLSMGWCYMIVCIFDFLIAPVLWSIGQAYFKGDITSQWSPLTLQGAGLFHLAMGAILGIEAFGKSLNNNQRHQHHNPKQRKRETDIDEQQQDDDICI